MFKSLFKTQAQTLLDSDITAITEAHELWKKYYQEKTRISIHGLRVKRLEKIKNILGQTNLNGKKEIFDAVKTVTGSKTFTLQNFEKEWDIECFKEAQDRARKLEGGDTSITIDSIQEWLDKRFRQPKGQTMVEELGIDERRIKSAARLAETMELRDLAAQIKVDQHRIDRAIKRQEHNSHELS